MVQTVGELYRGGRQHEAVSAIRIWGLGWIPASLRGTGTDFLRFIIGMGKPYNRVFPRLIEAVKDSDTDRIIDLCSGGGGPVAAFTAALAAAEFNLPVTLTDLYPSRTARQMTSRSEGRTEYPADPVEATAVPPNLTGFRTMFTSFHHFEPSSARRILANAVEARQPIGVFELTERKLGLAIFSLTNILFALVLTPFVRPFRWSRLLWIYTGVGPAVIWWDGMVSCLRSYTVAELEAMVDSLPPNDYRWQIGVEAARPAGITYLIGVPGDAT